jgi:hypothetical protein
MVKLVVIALVTASAMALSAMPFSQGPGRILSLLSLAQAPEREATPVQVLLALASVGLNADSIAAAGLTGTQSSLVTATLKTETQVVQESLAAFEAYQAARKRELALAQSFRASGSSSEIAPALQSARQALQQAEATWHESRTRLMGVIRAAIVTASDATTADVAVRLSQNADRPVPVEFRTLELTENQWGILASALANRAAGVRLSPSQQELLSSVEGRAPVALARASTAANRASVIEALAGQLHASMPAH